jgi:hypothetical protein
MRPDSADATRRTGRLPASCGNPAITPARGKQEPSAWAHPPGSVGHRAGRQPKRPAVRAFGALWRSGAYGPLQRLTWSRESGELHLTTLNRPGAAAVLAVCHDLAELERRLSGWTAVCPLPDSITWLRHAVRELPVARLL